MKQHIRPWLAVLVAALAFDAQAQADGFRVGFVNTDRIFREANTAKAAQAKLEQEFSRRENDLNDMGNSLKGASDKFEREAPTLSESQRVQRQKRLVDQDRDFQRKRREFQEDLNARKNEELQQLLERANRVVKQVAEQEKYDVVAAGCRVHQSQERHHRQGDQGAQCCQVSNGMWHSVYARLFKRWAVNFSVTPAA